MTDDLHTDGSAPADAPLTNDPTETTAADLPHRRLGIVASVAVAILLVDQASKWWAVSRLSGGEVIDLVGSLRFNLFFNTGVAFSLGSDDGLGPWISVLAIGVVVAVSFGATSRYPLGAVASGLISGGALGNLLDRAFR